MSTIDSVTHLGITVHQLDRSIKFYEENFGFTYLRGAHFTHEFFKKNHMLYQLPPGSTECHTAVLESPNRGLQLELFRFSEQLTAEQIPWNRCGLTHFALTTSNVHALAEELRRNNVEFCMDVGVRPDGGHWVFVRDPDGNLIEVMEPFEKEFK